MTQTHAFSRTQSMCAVSRSGGISQHLSQQDSVFLQHHSAQFPQVVGKKRCATSRRQYPSPRLSLRAGVCMKYYASHIYARVGCAEIVHSKTGKKGERKKTQRHAQNIYSV